MMIINKAETRAKAIRLEAAAEDKAAKAKAAIIIKEAEDKAEEIRQEVRDEAEADDKADDKAAKGKAAKIISAAEETAAVMLHEIEAAKETAFKVIRDQTENVAKAAAGAEIAAKVAVGAQKAAKAQAAIIIKDARDKAKHYLNEAEKLCDDAAKAGAGDQHLRQIETWVIETLLET